MMHAHNAHSGIERWLPFRDNFFDDSDDVDQMYRKSDFSTLIWLEGCESKMHVRSEHQFGLLPICDQSRFRFNSSRNILSELLAIHLLSTIVLSINLFAWIKIKRKWHVRHNSCTPMPARPETNGNFRSAVIKVVNAVHYVMRTKHRNKINWLRFFKEVRPAAGRFHRQKKSKRKVRIYIWFIRLHGFKLQAFVFNFCTSSRQKVEISTVRMPWGTM